MKSFVVMMIMLALGLAAPLAASAAPLAEVVSSGGLRPSPFPEKWGVRIEEDGTVVQFEDDETRELARLSAETVDQFRARIAEVTAAELVDPDPNLPPCTDVPTTLTTVRKSTGKTVLLMQQAACKTLITRDGRGILLLKVIEGLLRLQYLGR